MGSHFLCSIAKFEMVTDFRLLQAWRGVYVNNSKTLEWAGVATAIVYSMLVALNVGAEFIGFTLLLASSIFIGIWAKIGAHKGILFLQFFYALAGIIGMIRWFN